MATKSKSQEGLVRFIVSIILSIAASIGSCVLFFLPWIRLDLVKFVQECSVIQFYSGLGKIITELKSLEEQISSLVGQSTPLVDAIESLESIKLIPLGMIGLAVIIAVFQLLYIFKTVFGNGGRPFGIIGGLLTMVLSIGAIVLVLGYLSQINAQLADAATALDNMIPLDLNSLLDGTFQLDVTRWIKLTPFPFVSAALGLIEVIFAR